VLVKVRAGEDSEHDCIALSMVLLRMIQNKAVCQDQINHTSNDFSNTLDEYQAVVRHFYQNSNYVVHYGVSKNETR